MAIVWVNISLGSRLMSGEAQIKNLTRGTAQSGDVSVAVDTAKVTKRGDLMAALSAAADHLLSDTLK